MRNLGPGEGFDLVVVEARPGFISFTVSGKGALKLFSTEPGGHRWQRVPPSEKRGRVQTSTVTVAVLPVVQEREFKLKVTEVEFQTCRSSGAGGQNVNKVESAVTAVHIASGARVRCEGRSQLDNKRLALQLLESRLSKEKAEQSLKGRNQLRKDQLGSGERGDKVRTMRTQDNSIIDHATGNKYQLDRFLKGLVDFRS